MFVEGTVTAEMSQTTSMVSTPGTLVVLTQLADSTLETDTLKRTGLTETMDSPLLPPSIRPLPKTMTAAVPEVAVKGMLQFH